MSDSCASLFHHRSCREAEFVGLQEPFRDDETIRTTHRTVIARLGKLTADGVTSSEMSVFLIHPGLETITIRRDDSGQWLIADLDRFREGYTFTRFPLPEERNQFEYRCGGGNFCPTMSDDFAKVLFDFGGVSVVVSSTWEPAKPTTGEVSDAVLEGREFAAAHFILEEHTLASDAASYPATLVHCRERGKFVADLGWPQFLDGSLHGCDLSSPNRVFRKAYIVPCQSRAVLAASRAGLSTGRRIHSPLDPAMPRYPTIRAVARPAIHPHRCDHHSGSNPRKVFPRKQRTASAQTPIDMKDQPRAREPEHVIDRGVRTA